MTGTAMRAILAVAMIIATMRVTTTTFLAVRPITISALWRKQRFVSKRQKHQRAWLQPSPKLERTMTSQR